MENRREELGILEDKSRRSTTPMETPRKENLKWQKKLWKKEKKNNNKKLCTNTNYPVILDLQVLKKKILLVFRGKNNAFWKFWMKILSNLEFNTQYSLHAFIKCGFLKAFPYLEVLEKHTSIALLVNMFHQNKEVN